MFSAFDWLLILLLMFSMGLGVWRGFISEVMSLVGWFAGGVCALYFADTLAPQLSFIDIGDSSRHALAFVLIFILVLVLVRLLAKAFQNAAGAIGLGLFDRFLGALFGIARGLLVMTFFIIVLGHTPVNSAEFWKQSHVIQLCKQGADYLKPYLPIAISGFIP
jgi:membrane protein required for colicin V production